MYFYLIVALQGYCLFHMYKNSNSYYWALLIMLIPVVGCIIYLATQVYNRRDAEKIANEITHIVNPSKKIRDLESRLGFSDSYQNRINLAEALMEIKDYENAVPHLLEALEDKSQSGIYVIQQLVKSYFNMGSYDKAVIYAEKISASSEFKKSETQFLYGLALEKMGKIDEAETNLRQIDIRYSFYEERLVFAKFLLSINKTDDAKQILREINQESQHMTKVNRRIYKNTFSEVEKLLKELNE